MKILILTNLFPPDFLGGYELGCCQMADALRDMGHDVRVVTSFAERQSGDSAEGVARVLELAPIYDAATTSFYESGVHQHFHFKSTMVNRDNLYTVADIVEDFEPDVAYLWNLLGIGGLGLLGLLKHRGVPWVWHIMDMVPALLCGLGGHAVPQIAREFGTLCDGGTFIMCSTHVETEIVAAGIDVGHRVNLLPNWVTHSGLPRREQSFYGGGLRLVNAVGVLGEHKGTDILIDIAANLIEAGWAQFTLDIYGREGDPRFRRMLHERELDGVVCLAGSREQSELLRLYSNYDLFVFPTWSREPFGFAPLEAASFGCVPLFSADCGIAEWLVNDVHCLKAERSADAFTQRIIQVLQGEVDLAAMARRTQAVVTTEFHISRVAPRVASILEDAADHAMPPLGPVGDFHRLARLAEGVIPALLAEAQH